MRWSLPLARVAGIPIRIHASFVLLLAWIAWLGWGENGYVSSLWALGLILALFFCVVLHELGHSLVAMRFGAEVRSVTLFPIGGVASMKSIPEKPYQELLVSLAGPLVNVLIALVLSVARGGFPSWDVMGLFPSTPGELIDALIRANVILAVFNLLPAFPMDGGRVVRSILAMFLPYARATTLAAVLGQFIAVGFVLLGIMVNPFLILIGFFVFFRAETEEHAVRVRKMLSDVYARDVMLTEFAALSPDDTIERCLEYAHHRRQENFPVMLDGRMVGVLARSVWLDALHRNGSGTQVREVMKTNFISVDARTPLSRIYTDLRRLDQAIFPVISDGQPIGILTADDITRYLLVEQVGRSHQISREARKLSGVDQSLASISDSESRNH